MLLLTIAAWVLALVSIAVDGDEPDPRVLGFFVQHREQWLTTVMKTATLLGNYRLLIPLVVVVGLVCSALEHRFRPFMLLVATYTGAVVLTWALKTLVGRSRPTRTLALGAFHGPAFPSGHALQAVAVWGAVAYLVAAGASRPIRIALWCAAVTVAAVVGVSRMYLGAHWLTDVIGGWMLGACWLTAVVVLPATSWPTPRGADRGDPTARENRHKRSHFSLAPWYLPNGHATLNRNRAHEH